MLVFNVHTCVLNFLKEKINILSPLFSIYLSLNTFNRLNVIIISILQNV